MLWCLTLVALLASVQGRAVNISSTWMLPEEGFPVFYRHFRDRISWYEADAVCQFHHANLVTVDTTAQYDAVRAYLKELDISSAVWVGLIRSNPDGEFTWTDYRGLSSEGYWSSAPDSGTAPLCAAADPTSDYRWEARACGGPMVASFICELPVPSWATGSEGCMVKSLPALTALYLPESAAVQLTTDCGLAGVKIVQCTGNVKREELLQQLSCENETDTITTSMNDLVTINVVTTDVIDASQGQYTISETIMPSLSKIVIEENPQTGEKIVKINKDIESDMMIETKLVENNDNNLESNEIPKIVEINNFDKDYEYKKKINSGRLRNKEIHEELARLGDSHGYEKIFSQATDHFVPPLVIAKARLSDDMMELSFAEKHAQQLADTMQNRNVETTPTDVSSSPSEVSSTIKPVSTVSNLETDKQVKTVVPKKYIEKYVIKNKIFKSNAKNKIEKPTIFTTTETVDGAYKYSTDSIKQTNIKTDESEFSPIELTITLKDKDTEANKTPKELKTSNPTNLPTTTFQSLITQEPENNTENVTTVTEKSNNVSHEIIKVTIPNKNNASAAPIVLEVTTLVPTSEIIEKSEKYKVESTTANSEKMLLSSSVKILTESPPSTPASQSATTISTIDVTTSPDLTSSSTQKAVISTRIEVSTETDELSTGMTDTAINTEVTEINENSDESSEFPNSPLLSAANEPLRRPNRLRRPALPPSKLARFNPFRILG